MTSESNTELPRNTSQEISLSSVLQTLCCDDELSDLTLEGTDGEKIPVNRCVLAARSVVFRKMLFGKYCEATKSVIQLEYEGKVLKAVKEYCYTDHASTLFDEVSCGESWARSMMQLDSASDFLGLPMLQKKALDRICSEMKTQPALSCVIFNDATKTAGDSSRKMSEMALKVIRSRPEDALIPSESSIFNGAAALELEALNILIRDAKLSNDEITLFRALTVWSDADESLEDKENVPDFCSGKRKAVAVEKVKDINLKRIKPTDLCNHVEPSGLVTPNQLIEAFKAHALQSEKCVTIPPCWDVSNDAIFERTEGMPRTALLKHNPMVSGVHKWAIEILEGSPVDEIGVARADEFNIALRNDYLGNTEIGWTYESKGRKRNSQSSTGDFPPFQKGSIVTLTLDLTASGTLTASVDGENVFQLFDNLIKKAEGSNIPSFSPVVSLELGSAVRFLGFE